MLSTPSKRLSSSSQRKEILGLAEGEIASQQALRHIREGRLFRSAMKYTTIIVIFLLFSLMLAACGGSDKTSEATAPPKTASSGETTTKVQRQPLGSSSFFAINEVGLGPEGYVSLTNFTDVPVTLDGLYLCQSSECFQLPDVAVEGGDTVRVAAGDGAGVDNVVATNATFGELNPSDGEIALFTSQNLDDPEAIIEYVQWGSTPHGHTAVAVEAGIWPATGFGPSADYATRVFRRERDGLWLFEPIE
jgi:hypothetical protein